MRILCSLPIPLPPLSEQSDIAQILGTLDDKIELNRRMNATLEAIARALFKSWFVDFDPVRAKAEGRDTGLPRAIADLFSDEFEESELGEVPKGWGVGRLSDLVTNVVDRVQPSAATEGISYVPIECMSPRTICLYDAQPGINARSSLVRFQRGDILFGAMRPYFHKVCIAPFDGTTRTTAFVLRPDPSELVFTVFVVSRDETIDFATAHSEGSTIPYAKWMNSLDSLSLVLPPCTLRRQFHQVVMSMISRMMASVTESRTLAALRDALLPKLISGEVRVGDAARLVA
jgi:type I restriction enzyme, S subunit